MNKVKNISIVVPFYNEEENIKNLYHKLKDELEKINISYEIIFIDDGSIDNTYNLMKELAITDNNVKTIKFKFNCGQTAAMQAGFDFAKNEIIIPMDGDLQNDPSDIPRLISKIEEGYDVVSGWRKDRKDKTFSRILPSKIANKVISLIGKVHLHDYGCSLKAYRKDILKNVNLYGEMHRFIPIYASWYGAKVAEIPVTHHPRTKGVSKYGISRTFKVILDLVTIKFLGRYSTKPIYFFGSLSFFSIFLAFLGVIYLLYKWLFLKADKAIIDSPIFIFSVMCVLLSAQFVLMGILAEIQIRTYHESQNKRPYIVESTINVDKEKDVTKD
ncbi:MAG: glycosyltransferase family 2 protein [Spirochaetota bacterium]|nr:glycosyltransferase family 2 protein [Spirochaetota bacterium]